MDFTSSVMANVVSGLIVLGLGWFLGWVVRRFLRDMIAIKTKEEKNDDQIRTETTIRNTGFLSANNGPVFFNHFNQFNIADDKQINLIPISESIAVILPTDPKAKTYTFTVQGSMSPTMSTSTDAVSGSVLEGDVGDEN